jgi:polyisoprenoid-binding protein YceI
MKKKSLLLGLTIAMLFAFKPEKATIYTVDANKSMVTWIGRKVTGEHTGNIKIASGKLITKGALLNDGNFAIDMKSITDNDLTGEYMDKLLSHLKSEDFFSVEKNPITKFEITKVAYISANNANITGNLTIKGITNSITFPATILINGKLLTAEAKKIMVDRTKFDIRYGSKSFFNIGDKAIDNEFELNIKLVAAK